MQPSRAKKYNPRLKAVRTTEDGISFDSIAEKNFYLKLKQLLKGVKIIRPCNVNLQGKSRKWRVDFGLCAETNTTAVKLAKLRCLLKGIDYDETVRGMLFLEFKGETDLTTGFLRPDKNFISRIDHLAKYEPDILENTVFVGSSSGAIVSYCGKSDFRVTTIHTVNFFTEQVKNIW